MSAADGVLLVLLALAVVAALMVVTSRRLVHSALWLAVVLTALAAVFVVLHAEFVAGVQLLIYVGAVVVLLVFGIMLTRSPTGRSDDLDNGRTVLAALVALVTATVLGLVVGRAFREVVVDVGAAEPTTARSLGDALFGTWVLPFEVLSILLLAAVVGAIALSRRTDDPDAGDPDDDDLADLGRQRDRDPLVIHLVIPTVAAALIFSIGVYGVVVRRNAILVLMSVELMLNAVNLHLVATDLWWADVLHGGQSLAVFVITVAAAEVGVGIAVVLLVFRTRWTVDVDGADELDERAETAGLEGGGGVAPWMVTDEGDPHAYDASSSGSTGSVS